MARCPDCLDRGNAPTPLCGRCRGSKFVPDEDVLPSNVVHLVQPAKPEVVLTERQKKIIAGIKNALSAAERGEVDEMIFVTRLSANSPAPGAVVCGLTDPVDEVKILGMLTVADEIVRRRLREGETRKS